MLIVNGTVARRHLRSIGLRITGAGNEHEPGGARHGRDERESEHEFVVAEAVSYEAGDGRADHLDEGQHGVDDGRLLHGDAQLAHVDGHVGYQTCRRWVWSRIFDKQTNKHYIILSIPANILTCEPAEHDNT